MSTNVMELRRWLNTLSDLDEVGIDDGGLCLQSVNDPNAYYEVGGLPEDEDEEGGESV